MKQMILGLMLFMSAATIASAQDFTLAYDERNLLANQEEFVSPVRTVFPNPAISYATVILNYIPIDKVYIDLLDQNGNIRSSYAFAPGGRQLSFDVGFLDQGQYVLRVREKGRLLQIIRLIKS